MEVAPVIVTATLPNVSVPEVIVTLAKVLAPVTFKTALLVSVTAPQFAETAARVLVPPVAFKTVPVFIVDVRLVVGIVPPFISTVAPDAVVVKVLVPFAPATVIDPFKISLPVLLIESVWLRLAVLLWKAKVVTLKVPSSCALVMPVEVGVAKVKVPATFRTEPELIVTTAVFTAVFQTDEVNATRLGVVTSTVRVIPAFAV